MSGYESLSQPHVHSASSPPSQVATPSPYDMSDPSSPMSSMIGQSDLGGMNLTRISAFAQFRLLFWKNCIRKKRSWGHTLCEFLVPMLFIGVLLLLRTAFDKTTVPANYFDSPAYGRQLSTGGLGIIRHAACGCERDLSAWYDGRRANREMLVFTSTGTDAISTGIATGAMNHVKQQLLLQFTLDDKIACQCDPPHDNVYNIVEYIQNTTDGLFSVSGQFKSEADMLNYINDEDYDDVDTIQTIDKAFVFNQIGTPNNNYQWSYSIRTNGSDVPLTTMATDPSTAYSNDTFTKNFYDSGILTLQFWVDQYLIAASAPMQQEEKTQSKSFLEVAAGFLSEVNLYPMPEDDHVSDGFAETFGPILGLYFKLAFLWPFSRLIKQIVDEKERKIKEGLHMVGVNTLPYMASWIVLYLIGFGILSLIIALLTKAVIFPHTSVVLFFVFLYSFVLAILSLAIFMSAFFDSAKLAGFLSPMILYAMVIPFFAVEGSNSSSTKELVCILPPSCFALGAVKIAQLESAGVGAQFSNIWDVSYSFAVGTSIVWLLIDSGLLLIASWYVDKVVPKQYGTTEPWYFIVTPSYWKKSFSCLSDNTPDDLDIPLVDSHHGLMSPGRDVHIEAVSPSSSSKVGIRIRGLTKSFEMDQNVGCLTKMCMAEKDKKKLTAVDGLNLDLYVGQLFVLLGHNGAGKTTTINMLTGMYPPTAGTASVFGLDINKSMDRVRQQLGVCPQHSVNWDELTVEEHLTLFGGLKGLSGAGLKKAVETSIEEVTLEEKRFSFSSQLSGGQNRRLCLAMALIGDSKVVFLDEPTSGVDPHSRRAIWNLIQKKKQGRVIILTTHFMDEADQLGDRVCILSRGQIKCCGTSLFLKKQFGVGYSLTLTKASARDGDEDEHKANSPISTWDPSAITNLITTRITGAEKLSHSAGEIVFRLPIGTAEKSLPELFDYFDKNKASLGITTYGLSVTTLEDVFLKVAQEDEGDPAMSSPQPTGLNYSAPTNSNASAPSEKSSLLVSATYTTPASVASSALHDVTQQQSLMATLQSDPNEVSLLRQFQALIKKRSTISKRDRKALCCQIILPIIILIIGLASLNANKVTDYGSIDLTMQNQFDSPNLVYTNQNVNSFIAASMTQHSDEMVAEPVNAANQHDFDVQIQAQRDNEETSHYGAFYGDTPDPTSYTTLVNISAIFGEPTFINAGDTAILRGVTGKQQANIAVTLNPFPLTDSELNGRNDDAGFQSSMIITIAFGFIPASFCVFVVFERETNVKHLQLISGVGIASYWLSNLVWDLIMYSIPAAVCALILISNGNPNFTHENLPVVLLSLALYGASVIPFTYLCSFMFKSHLTAQNVMVLVYLIGGMGLLIVDFVLYASVPNTGKILRHFFRLLPNYCLGDVLFYLSVRHTSGVSTSAWDLDISGYDMLYMGLESIIYFCAVLFVEYCQSIPELNKLFSRADPDVPLLNRANGSSDSSERASLLEEDSDVAAERKWMQDARPGENQALIQLHGLRKTFPMPKNKLTKKDKVAVENLYFSVPAGEVFGFLGQNGAGKTTTLKILTGDLQPTSGYATLNGFDLRHQAIDARRFTGYCPQFDALHALQTGVETLEFYARIRGIPERNIPHMVGYLIDRLNLRINANQPVGGYSGGTKRKLSVGVALIGNPPIVFLDEPSTGMDPVSRRFLWNFISETMNQRAVILTTHSMEEAEALCNRIGILNSGSLVCLGTSQHLKSKFGRGFHIDVRTSVEQSERVRSFLEAQFPGSKVLEDFEGRIKIQTNPKVSHATLGQIFTVLEKNKEALSIFDYSCGQTSLESIFITMAKHGEDSVDNGMNENSVITMPN